MHLASVLVLFLFLLFFRAQSQSNAHHKPPKPHSQCFRYPDGVTVVWTCCRRNIALPADWLKAWLVSVEMISGRSGQGVKSVAWFQNFCFFWRGVGGHTKFKFCIGFVWRTFVFFSNLYYIKRSPVGRKETKVLQTNSMQDLNLMWPPTPLQKKQKFWNQATDLTPCPGYLYV